jgi:para-aminobenzoate synthetase component 1
VVSNKEPHNDIEPGKEYLIFINYDHKNEIEPFIKKENNPHQFPSKLYVEADEQFYLNFSDQPFELSGRTEVKINPTVTKEEYIKKVNTLKQHIQQGDIYEINYCITFEANNTSINPLSVYQKLNSISKASYSALAKFKTQYIISSSPELFLTRKQNTLITKPIKGTAKRGLSPEEDSDIIKDLQSNLKERTENIMIVDVGRNDLSRIAKRGTVHVDKLCDIETYLQVHQMVSTVSCTLRENIAFNDIIDATFPMASMTGAPKIRAMQLIDQYELYNRGPYSGALGYINKHGDFDLNVLIRSIFYDEEKRYLSFTVGSAITAMCNAEEEYEECMLKAKAMMQVLGQ